MLRSRKWTVAVGIVVILGVTGALALRGLRQVEIVLASPAEIRQITGRDLAPVPRSLVHRIPNSELRQVASSREIAHAAQEINWRVSVGSSKAEILKTEPHIQQLARLMRGRAMPIAGGGNPTDPEGDSSIWTARKNMAKVIALHIRLGHQTKDRERTYKMALLGREFEKSEWLAPPESLVEYLVSMASDRILERAIEDAVIAGIFTKPQLESLYLSAHVAPSDDLAMAAAIVADWNNYRIPWMKWISRREGFADRLKTWGATWTGTGMPTYNLVAGQLDEAATLREMALQYRTRLANLGRPWGAQDHRAEKRLQEVQKKLPEEPPQNASGIVGWWSSVRYRALMAGLPNSIGLQILVSATTGDWGAASFRRRVDMEGHRLTLLLGMYRADHGGQLPPNLDQLRPYLQGRPMPLDAFSGSDFSYDRARRVFWSVGVDGIDNSGTGAPRRSTEADYIWPAG